VGARIRGVAVVTVVLAVGAYLGSALYQWVAAPGLVPAVPGRAPVVGERVRVEVLNGGGRDQMARAATEYLRGRGFDVVFYGNDPACCRDSSVVVDRVGNLAWARSVADALGIREVRSDPDSNLFLDVSVVVGRTWDPPGSLAHEAADTLRWWDPRRLFKRPGSPGADENGRMADPGDPRGGE
jgi:hypothetical protein